MRRLKEKSKPGHRANNPPQATGTSSDEATSPENVNVGRQSQQEATSAPKQDAMTNKTGGSKSGIPRSNLHASLHDQEHSLLHQTTSEALWTQAYSALGAKEPQIVSVYEQFLNPDGDNVKPAECIDTVIRQLLYGQKLDQLVIKLFGKSFRIREIGENIINFISKSKAFITSVASVEPHAALAWAGVSLLLPLLLNQKEQNTAMMQGLNKIASLLQLYKLRVSLYIDKQPNELSDRNLKFEDAVIKVYTHILEFQARVVAYLWKDNRRQVARNIIKADDWQGLLDDIQASDANCLLYMDILDKEKEDSAWEKQHIQSDQQASIQKDIFEALNSLRREREADRNEELHMKLKHSLSTDYEEHKNVNPERVPGTCEWFLHSNEFLDWRNATDSRILWVSAGPGCGKSVLSRCLIDERLVSTSVMASTICYFFFKDGQEAQQTGANALKALTHQLLTQHPAANLIKYALPSFKAHGDKLGSMFGELWSTMLQILKDPATGEVVWVLDALDEGTEFERKKLLDRLIKFYSGKECREHLNIRLKILVTSRPYPDIEARFHTLKGSVSFVQLDGDELSDEISHEINLVIDYYVPRVASSLSKASQAKVVQKLQSMESRTYLWLHLMLEAIEEKMVGYGTENGLASIIDELPESVNDAYEGILSRSKFPEIARNILLIVLSATRALTVSEMNVALVLAIQGRRTSYEAIDRSSDDIFKSRVRQICGLFISIIDQKVYLLHQTAREFLLCRPDVAPQGWKYSLSLESAHSLIFHICVYILCLKELESSPQIDDTDEYSQWEDSCILLQYAATDWMAHYHLIQEGSDADLVEAGLKLCDTSSQSFATWSNLYRVYGDLPRRDIHVACYSGWYAVVERMLNNGADVNEGGEKGSPLHQAARSDNNHALVKLLLEHGAHVNAKSSRGSSALHVACHNGAMRVVQLLLDHGAEIDAVNQIGTALTAACTTSDAEVSLRLARLLIDRGTEIRYIGGCFFGTPLIGACYYGRIRLAQLLLEQGVYPNVVTKDLDHGTALITVYSKGHKETVQLLLEQKVDLNVIITYGVNGIVLITAYSEGHKEVAQLLLEHGADPNFATTYIGNITALITACFKGHKEIVQLLLEQGADPNVVVTADYRSTALITACYKDDKETVQLLLEHGADPNVLTKDHYDGTALIPACSKGHKEVVQLLLEQGADPNVIITHGNCGTALIAACSNGHKEIVQLLLEQGVDPNIVVNHGFYGTALIAACYNGYKEVA